MAKAQAASATTLNNHPLRIHQLTRQPPCHQPQISTLPALILTTLTQTLHFNGSTSNTRSSKGLNSQNPPSSHPYSATNLNMGHISDANITMTLIPILLSHTHPLPTHQQWLCTHLPCFPTWSILLCLQTILGLGPLPTRPPRPLTPEQSWVRYSLAASWRSSLLALPSSTSIRSK